MFGKMTTSFAALVAFASVAVMTSVAQAAAPQAEIISIKAGDLNLDTQAGATAMLARIDEAATKACWSDKIDEMAGFKACKDGVIFDAVKVLDRPLVSLVYAETYSTLDAKPMVMASR